MSCIGIEEFLESVKVAEGPGLLRRAGSYIAKHPWRVGVPAALGAAGLGTGIYALTRPEEEEKPMGLSAADIGEKALTAGLGHLVSEGAKGVGQAGTRAVRGMIQRKRHPRVFQSVINQDPLLMEVDPEILQQNFDTMARFAPTLATDPHAVQSFLREAVTSGGGINYNTIKLLADAENATRQQ